MTSSSPIIILSSSPDPRMVANRAAAASRVKSSATPSPKPHRHRPQALRIYSTLDARRMPLVGGHPLTLSPFNTQSPRRGRGVRLAPTRLRFGPHVFAGRRLRRRRGGLRRRLGAPIRSEFEKDDAQHPSTPAYAHEEEDEAILTQTTASDEGADAHQEVAKLWGDPDGDWAPADEESLADDENDEDDKSLEEEPEDVIVEDPGDDVLDGVFPDLLQQEEGDDLFIVIEGALLNDLLAEGATADEPIIIEDDYQVQESAITRAIVCTWTHYDHTEVPLQPWTHEDAGPSHAGHRSYACRRLNHGEVQIRHASGQWIPSWRARLNRPALPPVCDDCDPQVESAV
ncbi:unnamed protein product [Tilletia caries]|nr:unnamed protein product [Tilletia caries]